MPDVLPFRRADAVVSWLYHEFEVPAKAVRIGGLVAYSIVEFWPGSFSGIASLVVTVLAQAWFTWWWYGKIEKPAKLLSVSRFNAHQLKERETTAVYVVCVVGFLHVLLLALVFSGLWPTKHPANMAFCVLTFWLMFTFSYTLVPEGPSKRRLRERLAKLVPDFSPLPQGV